MPKPQLRTVAVEPSLRELEEYLDFLETEGLRVLEVKPPQVPGDEYLVTIELDQPPTDLQGNRLRQKPFSRLEQFFLKHLRGC